MIDYTTYDPARDADEARGHLCNSLNALEGVYRHKNDERLADYLARAQATIWYLRKQIEQGGKGNGSKS